MRAHPTKYAGVAFRSRLEARWAAFFDLVGWAWQYEPSDDAGWVPDFMLVESSIPVEVKPLEWSSIWAMARDTTHKPELAKVRESDRPSALVLGVYPFAEGDKAVVGAYLTKFDDYPPFAAALACSGRGKLDLWGESRVEFLYLASGEGTFRNEKSLAPFAAVNAAWREAGNRTQWRGAERALWA